MNALERFSIEVHARFVAADPQRTRADPAAELQRIALEVGAEWRDRQPLELVAVIDELEERAPALGPDWAIIRKRLLNH